MDRQQTMEGGKKNEIIEAATKSFFIDGYEGTSIRGIMRDVGCEAGLFYYYFKSKDELFSAVLDSFFLRYKNEVDEIIENGKRDIFRLLMTFFDYVGLKVDEFKKGEGRILHKATGLALKEKMLTVMREYISIILQILVENGATLQMDADVTAIFLAYGIGSIIINKDELGGDAVIPEMKRGVNIVMGLDKEKCDLMFPYYAVEEDIAAISELIMLGKNYIYDVSKYATAMNIFNKISANEIFVVRHNGTAVGVIGFSRMNNEVEYISVSSEAAHNGVGLRLFVSMLAQFPIGETIKVKIKDVINDENIKNIAFFKKFGFEVSEEQRGIKGYTDYKMVIPEKVKKRSRIQD